MFSFRLPLLLALVALTVASVMNWRAQIQTQQKLDSLNASLADRPAPTPTPPVIPPIPVPQSGTAPISRSINSTQLPPYVIEAPDVLLIEALVKNPKTGMMEQIPNQPISGQFPVRPDGSVGLGLWGSVSVIGLTIEQAANRIREHLAKARPVELAAEKLVVVVDVLAYNSKRYYILTNGGDFGERVLPFPITGSETVLDAIANVAGLPDIASKCSIRLVRKRGEGGPSEILPVDWRGITREGITATNYVIQAGDRIYVESKAQ